MVAGVGPGRIACKGGSGGVHAIDDPGAVPDPAYREGLGAALPAASSNRSRVSKGANIGRPRCRWRSSRTLGSTRASTGDCSQLKEGAANRHVWMNVDACCFD
jgi:hypothetical protein